MSIIQTVSDATREGSLAHRFRARRFEFFRGLLDTVPRPVRILDVGGTEAFWHPTGLLDDPDLEITICNLSPGDDSVEGRVRFLECDACDLAVFDDDSFEVVFSNSVIEHVGDLGRMGEMAQEVMRVGQRFFVQTPSRHFPLDPHFPFPFFQFLPVPARAVLLRVLPLAWVGRIHDPGHAREVATSVRLLSERELRGLFPGAGIYKERLFGLTKSLTAYGGW